MNNKEQELQVFMKNIVFIRKHYGLSKELMAKILGIGIASLNKIERGVLPERLSVDVIFRIEQYFKIKAKDQFEVIADIIIGK